MGISTVTLSEKSFDAPDTVLEVWLRLFVDAVDTSERIPAWLRELCDDWQILATEEFGSGSAPDLDGVIIDDDRRLTVLQLARQVLARLETFGDPIPARVLNTLGSGNPETQFPKDLPAELFLGIARAFVTLLELPLRPRRTASKLS